MAKSVPARRKRARQTPSAKVGLPPGEAVFAGVASDRPIRVAVMDYAADHLVEEEVTTAPKLCEHVAARSTTWIHVDGLHDSALVQRLTSALQIHPLWIEDILNPRSRPKGEWMGPRLLLVTRAINPLADGPDAWSFDVEQNTFLLGRGFLMTFQEHPGDPWGPIRDRLREPSTRLRREGPDHLLHALLDALVDQFFVVLERIEAAVDDLEDAALLPTTRDLPQRFASLKADLVLFRSAALPMRDALSAIRRSDEPLITPDAGPYFQDVADHVEQAIEAVDVLRERARVALELHLAVANQSLNEVLRVLTLVSTFFMPLTFIAGIYGMNFEYMPELAWPFGYFGVLGVMAALSLAMLAYFRRNNWI